MTDDVNIVIGVTGKTEGAKRVKRELDGVGTSADKATGHVDKFDKKLDSTSKTASAFASAMKGVLAVVGVREIVRTIDDFTLLEARIKNSTRSVEEFNTAFRSLRDVSAQTGASFESAVEVFQRISFVRDEINATSETMVQFTANVQKLGVVSGASTQALNAGLTQLGQGLSAGILRAEEFNSILENIPAVGQAIAKEFGVTTGQLRNLVLDGQVLSEDVFAAILNQTSDINDQFDKFPKTIGRAFNEFLLQLQSSASELEKVVGLTNILIEGFRVAGNVLDSLVGLIQGFGNTIKAFFSLVIAGILDAFNSATRLVEKLINTAISGINKLKREDIPLLNISSDVSRADLSEAALTSARSEIDAARAGFLRAFDGAADIFNSDQNNPVAKQVESTRELSKNYSKIAESISDGTKKTKEADKAAKKLSKTVDSGLKDIWVGIERDIAQAFKGGFEEGEGFFDKFANGIKSSFSNLMGEIAYQAARPIALNLVAGITGSAALTGGSSSSLATGLGSMATGAGSSAGGGIFDSLGSIGSGLINGGLYSSTLGNIGANIGANLFGGGQLLSSSAFIGAQALGNLGYGAIGGGVANLLGLGGGIGGTIGGTLGSIAGGGIGASLGTILGLAGGPVGAIVGSFLGTAVGGLFGGGSTPSRAIDRTFSLDGNGQLYTSKRTSDEASSEQEDAFNKLSVGVNESVNKLISSLGAELESIPQFLISQTRREGIQARVGTADTLSGSTLQSFSSIEDAVDYALTDALSRADLSGVSDQFEQMFKDIFAKGGSVEERINEVLEAKAIFDIIDAFEEAADTTSPLLKALDELDDQFASLREKALGLGLPIDKLTDAYEAQREAIIDNTLKPLQDFLDSQSLSNISSLSPTDKLSLARSQFDDNLSAISSGDYSNIDSLTQQASQLLQIGRDVFASGAGFTALESFVRQAVVGVGDQLGGDGALDANISREIVISNAEQVSLLEQQNAIIQQQAEEIRKLRKSMERVGNLLVIQS